VVCTDLVVCILNLWKLWWIPWVCKTSAGATFRCKHVSIFLELGWPYIYWRLHWLWLSCGHLQNSSKFN
jgi:hypothetical protein